MTNLRPQAQGTARPKVLLADTNRWALSARLAIALTDVGCDGFAICVAPSHALMKTRAIKRVFRYRAFHALESLEAAIEAVEPDAVIPSWDRSPEHLPKLYEDAQGRGPAGAKLVQLLEHSLGSPGSYPIVSSRYDLLSLAREEGVPAPETIRISSLEDLEALAGQQEFPWVLKADGTWGGVGVKVIHSAQEIVPAWAELTRMYRFKRALKRFVVNRDPFPLYSWSKGTKRATVVQTYIDGRPANCTAFAWQGQLLGLIGVEVVQSEGTTGPACIVRIVENEQMKYAASRIASRLSLSGFFGLDFMVERKTGIAYLIEMNPWIATPCHLRLGKGRDLPGALWSRLADQPLPKIASEVPCSLIAYQAQFATSKDKLN